MVVFLLVPFKTNNKKGGGFSKNKWNTHPSGTSHSPPVSQLQSSKTTKQKGTFAEKRTR